MRRIVGPLLLIVFAAGCGDGSPPTYTVKGAVTWNGQPVKDGFINFMAEDGITTNAVAKIVDGKYETRSTAGKKKVEVYADKDMGFSKAMNQNVKAQLFPTEYNAKSELRFEVAPNDDNVYDLHLPKKP